MGPTGRRCPRAPLLSALAVYDHLGQVRASLTQPPLGATLAALPRLSTTFSVDRRRRCAPLLPSLGAYGRPGQARAKGYSKSSPRVAAAYGQLSCLPPTSGSPSLSPVAPRLPSPPPPAASHHEPWLSPIGRIYLLSAPPPQSYRWQCPYFPQLCKSFKCCF